MKKLSFIFEPDTDQKKPLLLAAERRGLEYNSMEIEDFSFDGDKIYYQGKLMTAFPETAINRTSNGAEMSLYPHFVKNGVAMINSWHTTQQCNDKLKTCNALDKHGISQPKTVHRQGSAEYEEIAAQLGTGAIVAKSRYGRQGASVFLIKNERDFRAAMAGNDINDFIFQEFIGESSGKDLRTYVVGDKFMGAVMRENDNDFRSNISLGGKAYKTEPSRELQENSVKAAQAVGGGVVSIDYLVGKDNFLVCEANANACIETFESLGVPLANELIDYYASGKYKKFNADRVKNNVSGNTIG